jgi:chromosomal replication initiator protein
VSYSSYNQKSQPLELLWKACLGRLQLLTTKANFDTWLKDSSAVSMDGSLLIIEVPSSFAAEWLEQRLSSEIRRTASDLTGKSLAVSFHIRGTSLGILSDSVKPKKAQSSSQSNPRVMRSNTFTFASFVESPTSRLALAAAFVATSEPGLKFNPLFIHGSSGFGKTHLLKAICHGSSGQGLHPLYVTAETFTNDFIAAVQRRETTPFREKYLAPDIVLIDDIQFLASKLRTQDALFHIFEDLLSFGKQIVLASDRAPSALGFQEERLYSRLQSGLVAKLGPSSSETKAEILLNKARLSSMALSPELADFLATRLPDNIRILEGCLTKYLALIQLGGALASEETASLALTGISSFVSRPSMVLSPKELLTLVSAHFGVTEQLLIGPSRSSSIVQARHVAMFLLREDLGYSLAEIGRFLGNRDHTTVLHGCSKVISSIEEDTRLADAIGCIRSAVGSRLSPNPSTSFPQPKTLA